MTSRAVQHTGGQSGPLGCDRASVAACVPRHSRVPERVVKVTVTFSRWGPCTLGTQWWTARR